MNELKTELFEFLRYGLDPLAQQPLLLHFLNASLKWCVSLNLKRSQPPICSLRAELYTQLY